MSPQSATRDHAKVARELRKHSDGHIWWEGEFGGKPTLYYRAHSEALISSIYLVARNAGLDVHHSGPVGQGVTPFYHLHVRPEIKSEEIALLGGIIKEQTHLAKINERDFSPTWLQYAQTPSDPRHPEAANRRKSR